MGSKQVPHAFRAIELRDITNFRVCVTNLSLQYKNLQLPIMRDIANNQYKELINHPKSSIKKCFLSIPDIITSARCI